MTHDETIKDIDDRLRNVTMHLEIVASMVHSHDAQLEKAATTLQKASDTMDRVTAMMENHEQRIEDLENGKRQ